MIKVTVGNNLSRKAVIVPETSTLREILEANEVNYNTGMTSLDGATLAPGDIDKTFADFGITEKCYLLNVVKADNAVNISILGEAAVLTSMFQMENLKTILKYKPSALVVQDEETKEETFRVDIAKAGAGRMNRYGISFSPTPDKNGWAQVTVSLPEEHGDAKDYIEDTYGETILNLKKLENKMFSILGEIGVARKAIRDSITEL